MDQNQVINPPLNPQVNNPSQEPAQESPKATNGQDNFGHIQTKSNTGVYFLLGIITIIALSLVGLFFYKQFTNITSNQNPPTITPIIEVTPTEVVKNTESLDLNQIKIPDFEEEISEVKAEVEEL